MISAFKFFKEVFRVFNELYRNYRLKMIGLSGLGILAGLFEGLGVSLLVPLFALYLGNEGVVSNKVITLMTSVLSAVNLKLSFTVLLSLIIIFFIFKAGTLFVFGYLRIQIVKNFTNNLRADLYRKALSSDYSFLSSLKSGFLDNVILVDVKSSAKFLDNITGVILSVSSFLVYLGVAFTISRSITFFAAFFGILLLFYFRPIMRKIRYLSRQMISARKLLSHSIIESLRGIKTLKSMGYEADVLENAKKLFDETEKAEKTRNLWTHAAKISIEPASIIFIAGLFSISYLYLEFSLATFVPIVYLINQVFLNLERIQSSIHGLVTLLPSVEEVIRFSREAAHSPEDRGGDKHYSFADVLEFHEVSFAYPKAKINTLHDLNFSIKRGESVAIIGPSGAGKTSLVDLLLRLNKPTTGSLKIDGRVVEEIELADWRRHVVYVPQEAFLRNTSIVENIRFYDGKLSREKIEESARLANIHDFIVGLPAGYDTVVGERGTRLSGGERQRIALARALSRDPDILVLDEATSALDTHSEGEIKKTLKELKGKRTIIIIAHNPGTIDYVDRVVAIKNGRVTEEGSRAELLDDKGSYLRSILDKRDIIS